MLQRKGQHKDEQYQELKTYIEDNKARVSDQGVRFFSPQKKNDKDERYRPKTPTNNHSAVVNALKDPYIAAYLQIFSNIGHFVTEMQAHFANLEKDIDATSKAANIVDKNNIAKLKTDYIFSATSGPMNDLPQSITAIPPIVTALQIVQKDWFTRDPKAKKPVHELVQAIAISLIINDLSAYRSLLSQESDTTLHSVISLFYKGGHSKEKKIEAINKFILQLSNPNAAEKLDAKDIEVLNSGRAGKIIEKYRSGGFPQVDILKKVAPIADEKKPATEAQFKADLINDLTKHVEKLQIEKNHPLYRFGSYIHETAYSKSKKIATITKYIEQLKSKGNPKTAFTEHDFKILKDGRTGKIIKKAEQYRQAHNLKQLPLMDQLFPSDQAPATKAKSRFSRDKKT